MAIVSANQWRCDTCNAEFLYDGDPVSATCPSCQSIRLTRFIYVEDEFRIAMHEHATLKAKDPTRRSAERLRREVRAGRRTERSGSGKLVDEYRVIDHDTNTYVEKIVDVETGDTVRDVCESLDSHRGGTENTRNKTHDV
jgi:hypothetical protein